MRNLSLGQFAKHEFVPRFNPNTVGARVGFDVRAGDTIPEGHSITGITYQNNPDGSHAGTLLHVRPEVQNQSLITRAWRGEG